MGDMPQNINWIPTVFPNNAIVPVATLKQDKNEGCSNWYNLAKMQQQEEEQFEEGMCELIEQDIDIKQEMEGKKRSHTNGDYCTVLGCKNSRRSKCNVIKSHVGILRWHSPRNESDAQAWQEALDRGSEFKVRLRRTKVWSNHFAAGYYNPNCSVPTLYMKGYGTLMRTRKDKAVSGGIPKKRKRKDVAIPVQNEINNDSPTLDDVPLIMSTADLHDHDYFTSEDVADSCKTR